MEINKEWNGNGNRKDIQGSTSIAWTNLPYIFFPQCYSQPQAEEYFTLAFFLLSAIIILFFYFQREVCTIIHDTCIGLGKLYTECISRMMNEWCMRLCKLGRRFFGSCVGSMFNRSRSGISPTVCKMHRNSSQISSVLEYAHHSNHVSTRLHSWCRLNFLAFLHLRSCFPSRHVSLHVILGVGWIRWIGWIGETSWVLRVGVEWKSNNTGTPSPTTVNSVYFIKHDLYKWKNILINTVVEFI